MIDSVILARPAGLEPATHSEGSTPSPSAKFLQQCGRCR